MAEITFDFAKNQSNIAKHGVSLAFAEEIDWSEVWCAVDSRKDYGELREVGFAFIGARLYCVVFTQRGETSISSACARPTRGRPNIMPTTIKTRSGRELILPTPEEDAEIQRGIDADPDTFELTEEFIARMKPLKMRGRPPSKTPKVQLSMRYDADIIEAFRASGEGWQTRMNNALRDWLKTHTPG